MKRREKLRVKTMANDSSDNTSTKARENFAGLCFVRPSWPQITRQLPVRRDVPGIVLLFVIRFLFRLPRLLPINKPAKTVAFTLLLHRTFPIEIGEV